jgi:hypothetical protein
VFIYTDKDIEKQSQQARVQNKRNETEQTENTGGEETKETRNHPAWSPKKSYMGL